MRILHFIERVRLSVGGTVRGALDMCSGLAGAGHDVTLMTLDDADVPGPWRDGDRVKVECLGAGAGVLGRLDAAQATAAREAVRRADVVHIHAVWDVTNAQIATIARGEGRPYVVSAHGMLDDWAMAQKRLKKIVYLRAAGGNRFLRGAAAMHFTSASEAEQSPKWAPGVRACMIPLLFDATDYERLPGPGAAHARFGIEAGGPPVLGFLSRLTPGKRADVVIDAAGVLRRRGVALRLVIAGSGGEAEVGRLRRMAEGVGVGSDTIWTGAVYGVDKVSLYQAMSVFALPSDHENFCFALVEAMAAGTPAATVRTVGIWREAASSGGGVVCEPTGESLADAVEPWLRDHAAARAAGEAARRWVRDTLNIDRVASEYVRMYEEALRKRETRR